MSVMSVMSVMEERFPCGLMIGGIDKWVNSKNHQKTIQNFFNGPIQNIWRKRPTLSLPKKPPLMELLKHGTKWNKWK